MSEKWSKLLFETSEGGVSSAVAPELLPDNQTAWMLNGTNRGGKPATRPNIEFIMDLPDGLVQGAEFFGVQGGMIIASIAGQMYRIRVMGGSFSADEIPLDFINSPVIKQVWMTQTVETLVIQDGQSNPILYDGSTAIRAVSGEVPRGRQMAYGNGRLWVAVNANEVVAGDIRTGAPGSELFFTESTYLQGGGKLFFPSDITGMAFIPVTGQADYGALLVFSADETNAIRADITSRDDWGKIPGFVTGILRSVGSASQWSITSVNQDLYWRDSNRGIRSIRNALADESGPGSSPLSREVSRLTDYDSQRQLAFCSSIVHDNRLLMTSSPFLMENGGVGFKNLIALDFAPLSTMQGKSQAAYDGQWNGLRFVKLVAGKFRGKNRAFTITTDEYGRNQLWEFGTGNRDDVGASCSDGTADPIDTPIRSFVEYPLRNFGNPKQRKRLERCDVWLSGVDGPVTLKVYWRSDNSIKWLLWDEAETCAQTSDPSTAVPHVWKNLRSQERPQFKTFTIPDQINDVIKYAANIGFEFQIRLVWTGRLKIHRVMLYGTELSDPAWADRAGFASQCVENDITGNQVEYHIPSLGCSQCPFITENPVDQTIEGGQDTQFVVETSGTVDSHQWQFSDDGGMTWQPVVNGTNYSGATTATLSVLDAPGEFSGYLYRAVINTEGCIEQISADAELTVQCQAIMVQPDDEATIEGGSVQFSVTASLTGLSYQWQVSTNGGGAWSDLSNSSPYSGVTTATLTVDPVTVAMNGYLYRCVVSRANCPNSTSNPGELTVATDILAEFLLSGGGGGGGIRYGAGGSAGQGITGSDLLNLSTTYPIVIGGGGVGGTISGANYRGSPGSESTFNGHTAACGEGGGGGGDFGTQQSGGSGYNGGGSTGRFAGISIPGGVGTNHFGGSGLYGGSTIAGGGGGGATSDGDNVQSPGLNGGNGGVGFLSSISGASLAYCGGGGGSANPSTGTPGVGFSGGGNGGTGDGNDGVRGGGGGGGYAPTGASAHGGRGSDGFLIVRYTWPTPLFTGGTITQDGGDQIHTFSAAGSFSLAPI
jgi:hypothetical protein